VTRRLFWEDAYRLDFEARVVSTGERDGQPTAVLDQTAFYPESGGQPHDVGRLGDIGVLDVQEDGESIVHILERTLAEGDSVKGSVDAQRRRDHRQQHHGQHLLSRAFVELAGAHTRSFHLGRTECSIDLDADVAAEGLRRVESLANDVIWEARPILARSVPREEAAAMGIHLDADAGETIRIVEATDFDRQACCGTHPRNTAEVGVVIVLGSERAKGSTRVRFVCGHRALAAAHDRVAAVDELGALFSAPLDGLVEAARQSQEQQQEAERRSRELLDRALEGEAHRLLGAASGAPPIVMASYDGWSPSDLRGLAQHLTRLGECVALLGTRSDKAHLIFAQSESLDLDIPGRLKEAVEKLGGRGGGRRRMAQGGGARVELLDTALADAKQRLEEDA